MNLLRTSLRTLMVIVGVMAVDLAVARAFWGSRHHVLSGIALTGLLLNAGFFRLIRGRGLWRAFWAGLLLAGFLAAGSFIWAITYPKASATFIDQRTGKQVTIRSSGAPLSDHWEGYLDFAEDSLEKLPPEWNPLTKGELAALLADACIAFAPQLVVALAGGLLFWLIAFSAGARSRAVRHRVAKLDARQVEGLLQ